jgi:hypothetical protein
VANDLLAQLSQPQGPSLALLTVPAATLRFGGMKALFPLTLSLAVLLSTGCATGSAALSRRQTEQKGMLYGAMKVPAGYDRFTVYQFGKVYLPPFAARPEAFIDAEGNFAFSNLEPGRYFFYSYYSEGVMHLFPTGNAEQNKRFIFDIEPGQLVFTGAWEKTGETRNVLSPDEFHLEARESPSRQEVLKALLKPAQGTGWEAALQAQFETAPAATRPLRRPL